VSGLSAINEAMLYLRILRTVLRQFLDLLWIFSNLIFVDTKISST
jgi:hypothetical protein